MVQSTKLRLISPALVHSLETDHMWQHLTANGAPVDGANVILSSRDAVKSSFGLTDANGQTSGLTFAIYSMDANQVTDYTSFLNTYELNSIAAIAYDWTDASTNTGDFRYIFTTPTLQDALTDVATNVNADSFAFVDNVDVRICSNLQLTQSSNHALEHLADTDYENLHRFNWNGRVW